MWKWFLIWWLWYVESGYWCYLEDNGKYSADLPLTKQCYYCNKFLPFKMIAELFKYLFYWFQCIFWNHFLTSYLPEWNIFMPGPKQLEKRRFHSTNTCNTTWQTHLSPSCSASSTESNSSSKVNLNNMLFLGKTGVSPYLANIPARPTPCPNQRQQCWMHLRYKPIQKCWWYTILLVIIHDKLHWKTHSGYSEEVQK